MKLGQTEEALDDFRSALANHPAAEPDLVIEATQALATNGCDEEAVRHVDQGVARLSSIPSLNLKILEIELNGKRHDVALTRLDGMQRLAPRPEPWMERRATILARYFSGARMPGSRAWCICRSSAETSVSGKRVPPVRR